MGFLDYAWAISLQKDRMKAEIRSDSKLQQPTLKWKKSGCDITLPVPSFSEETISFLGYEFPMDQKILVGRLFRACISHLTAHTLGSMGNYQTILSMPKHTLVESFVETLVADAYVNAYISVRCPDNLADVAFANALAFEGMKPLERIFNPATRMMTALLSKSNIGITKGKLSPGEENAVARLCTGLDSTRKAIIGSLTGEEIKLDEVLDETANLVIQTLEANGPILQAPSLPHTEQIGPSTIFLQFKMPSETKIENIFRQSLETLSGVPLQRAPIESHWRTETNVEALQAFDSSIHQKTREQKILARIEKYVEGTRFKSVGFPEEDYTQYLRARTLLRGGSRRLLDSLRVARDALDEDPRKELGQLDLTEVIQKISSNSPRTDVFMENEYLSRSFAWGILFDVSASIKVRGELSRALAICIAEATRELLMDPASWSFFAFNDRFHVLKDSSEAYSRRVRARIGGLKYGGLTFMPDAVRVAGEILKQRFDEQKFLIVVSDGFPYGYPDVEFELQETVAKLKRKGIIAIGVGLKTERMDKFFKESCSVYSQRDLIKKFSKIYVGASTAALEA